MLMSSKANVLDDSMGGLPGLSNTPIHRSSFWSSGTSTSGSFIYKTLIPQLQQFRQGNS